MCSFIFLFSVKLFVCHSVAILFISAPLKQGLALHYTKLVVNIFEYLPLLIKVIYIFEMFIFFSCLKNYIRIFPTERENKHNKVEKSFLYV
jgi:hypothetical protein